MRTSVLSSALIGIDRMAFSPNKPLEVSFLGEVAQDGGGPRREFFRLLGHDVKNSLCIGSGDSYVFRHDVVGLQCNKFEKLGKLMAMSLAQDGGGFPFFASSFYAYICGKDINSISIDISQVPDYEACDLLYKMKAVPNDKSLQDLLLSASDVVINSGYTKPLVSTKLTDIPEISRCISLHYTLIQSLAEMNQLKKGLASLGLLEIMQNHSDLVAPFFTSTGFRKLTADVLQNIFKDVRFSEEGSSARLQEETTYMLFQQLLNDCEGAEEPDLTLEEILSFFSGSDRVPPLGFKPAPSILFNEESVYPKCSTCALSLILPTKYHGNYTAFKDKVTFAIKEHGGFGLL